MWRPLRSGADEFAPRRWVLRCSSLRRQLQCCVRHHVGNDAGFGVVMTNVSKACKKLRSQLDQFGWRLLIEVAPDREGQPDVVHDRCAREQRSTPERDAQATANGIVEMLAGLQLDLGGEPRSDAQRKPLVGAVIAASWTGRLEPSDLGRSIRHPVRRDVIR